MRVEGEGLPLPPSDSLDVRDHYSKHHYARAHHRRVNKI